MSLDLGDCIVSGTALTAPFLRDGLRVSPEAAQGWDALHASLGRGGAQRVHQRVTSKLALALGYGPPRRQDAVATREGPEDGGYLLQADGVALRAWSAGCDTDLDAADRRSMTRGAQRVLFARGERAGLLTNGDVLRLLLCDPIRADSSLSMPLDVWRGLEAPPDSWRVLATLVHARSLPNLSAVLDAARLHQARVTTALRHQAKDAIVGFINALPDKGADAQALWRESLVLVYRLLFILKLESPAEPGLGFSFASTRLWRTALSPNRALGPLVRRHLDLGHDTGRMLESGLRTVFALFRDGVSCSELRIAPLGGALFGAGAMPLLDRLEWGDRAVAILLDKLIWTSGKTRDRVHYGSLGVEDLGSVYEALLEQEPGIATEPLIRVRRGKQVSLAPANGAAPDVMPSGFFLRAGNGRKASGSFYTPHEFVRFLVRETLDPKIAALSPLDDPCPAALLTLKIVDPATGSGHFLVEACRYLGEALLAACRLCDERGLHGRIAALPDPDATLVPYLPSRGYSENRARAICRRLVAVHCLYGCDRNKLAVELAKLSLWLESYAEGLPLTFLDHRLVHGDALTGPFVESLATLPVTGGPLDPLLAQGVTRRLRERMALARRLVGKLNASIGRDVADLAAKQAVKERLDALLFPLRQLTQAWTRSAMLRERDGDDLWLRLARHVAETGQWPENATQPDSDAIAWDLTFPEVFPTGFSVVLGNPPWDVVQHNTKDFVAGYDPRVLEARTSWERARIEQDVLARPDIAAAFRTYRAGFEHLKHVAQRLYPCQRAASGNLDLYRLFAERNMSLAAADGAVGVLLPSAFHANDSSNGIRRLYFDNADLTWCLSFENRRRVFDIDSRFKFDLIVAQRPGPTMALRCGFYLERIEDATDTAKIMTYAPAFLAASGGGGLMPLELRGTADQRIAERLFAQPERLGHWCERRKIRLGRDLHMTDDAGCFLPAGVGALTVHEGKTFHQYTDRWDTEPRYSVTPGKLRPAIAEAARHGRLAFRDIARSNDERTMIAFMAPPGVVFGHTATVEKTPWARPQEDALALCALFNAFAFDWLVRQRAATHLSLYLLEALPVPRFSAAQLRFLAHAALRLSCPRTDRDTVSRGPDANDQHWQLRARVDAMVAHAYELDRAAYAHVLASFTHRSYPQAPVLCLRAFDGTGP